MKQHSLIIDALAYERHKSFGFQEYLFNLLDYFYKHRNTIFFDRIIVICDISQLNDFERFKDKFEIIGYKIPNLFSRFFIQCFIPFQLRLEKSDVILNLSNYSGLFKRCKNVLVIHDLLYLRKHLLRKFLVRLQRNIFVPRSVALADNIIAISNFTKEDILKNFRIKDNVEVTRVYNYFNFKKFKIENLKSGIINNDVFFLSVSSSEYHKNTIAILKAFEKYCSYNSEKKLYIIGEIKEINAALYYENLNPLVKKRIQILSKISNFELAFLYDKCEAYISATFFEGLGMPIIEAMYFNASLILSDIGICREVTDSQAVFFDPNSYEDLFDKMLNVNNEKRNTRPFVKIKFSSKNTSKKYIQILNQM